MHAVQNVNTTVVAKTLYDIAEVLKQNQTT